MRVAARLFPCLVVAMTATSLACGELLGISGPPIVVVDASDAESMPTEPEASAPAPEASSPPLEASTPDALDGDSSDAGLHVDGDADAACAPGTCTLTFASSSTWDSYGGTMLPDGAVSDSLGTSLGPAREVCLSSHFPGNCPDAAIIYGSTGMSWISLADQVDWIWRGDVVPSQPSGLALAAFQKTFAVGDGAKGSVDLLADDFAAVFVNGTRVGTTGSTSDLDAATHAPNVKQTFDLSPWLHAGENTITIVAQNGPSSWASTFCGGNCTYADNPAGVTFSGTLTW